MAPGGCSWPQVRKALPARPKKAGGFENSGLFPEASWELGS